LLHTKEIKSTEGIYEQNVSLAKTPLAARRSSGSLRENIHISLFPLRRAHDILVRDRFVIALFLPLEVQIADTEAACAVIDAEHPAFLLMTGRDEPIVAGLLFRRALPALVTPKAPGPTSVRPGL
jgi:hypothetical protein